MLRACIRMAVCINEQSHFGVPSWGILLLRAWGRGPGRPGRVTHCADDANGADDTHVYVCMCICIFARI